MGFSPELFARGWLQTTILLILIPLVARIKGMSHQCQARIFFFLTIVGVEFCQMAFSVCSYDHISFILYHLIQ
jgi:hypothetical protein